jgi:amino acid transporter
LPDSETGTKPTAFARESTGLVKNVSFLDSIALNFSNMSVGPLMTTIAGSTVATMVVVDVAGLNLILASVIGFLLAIPQMVVYTMMSRRFPRTGGDYVWISRTFGGFWGSTLSFWGYTMETLAFIALVVILVDYSIGGVGLTMGLDSWGSLFTDGNTQFIVGSVIFAIMITLNIVKPKAGFKVVTILTVFGIFTLLLSMGVLLAAGQSGVENYINGLSQIPGFNLPTYTQVLSSYTPSGLPGDISLPNIIYIMPVMFAFVFPWLNAAPAVASEIKGSRALKWNVPVSAFLGFVLLTATFAVLYGVSGMPFINALFHNPAYAGFGVNFFSLAMGVANNNIVAWIIGLGWIAMQLGVIAYAVIIFSRYVLAQAMDRFLPTRLAYVSPKLGSPVIAHLFDLVVTVTLVALTAYFFSSISGIFGAIIAGMSYFVFVGLAAATHAIRKESGMAKAVLATAGILNAVVFAFITYQFLANPGFTGLNTVTYIYVVGTFIAGAAIYQASKWYHKKRGMDISLNYKELPPE